MASESKRAIEELGAAGMQIYTNIKGQPLDHPDFEAFFEYMNESGKPIWMHPARGQGFADYQSEDRSEYEIWWTFGWPYETSAAMARLVFSGMFDRYPNLNCHHASCGWEWSHFSRGVSVLAGTRWVSGLAIGISEPVKRCVEKTAPSILQRILC
jgi:predicted TIM-barrel fold metal-dependent hydrolase